MSDLAKTGSNSELEQVFSVMISKLQGPKVLTLMRQLIPLAKTVTPLKVFLSAWVQLLNKFKSADNRPSE